MIACSFYVVQAIIHLGAEDRMKDSVNSHIKGTRRIWLGLAIILAILLILSASIFIYLKMQTKDLPQSETAEQQPTYHNHYIFIADDLTGQFWDEVYQAALECGETYGAYVEAFGDNLAVRYSKEELMEMAVAANPDGIILEGEQSEEMLSLIDKAIDKEIPVVTVLKDVTGSRRQSYVGISNYDLGREYGRQIIQLATKETKDVLIIMNSRAEEEGKNIIYTGIAETLQNEGNHLELTTEIKVVEEDTFFDAQEIIRDIFLNEEEIPEIIICLDEQNTISAYQAVIDYNMVGKVNIIGYYTSETILDAISKQVIYSTILVDTRQLGKASITALQEYQETGHVSDYMTIDVRAITKRNVQEYIKNVSQENK